MLPPSQLTQRSPPLAPLDPPALVYIGNCIDKPSQTRYRRPRQFLDLPRSYPRTLRLAARGAMPSRPSLLPTIMEVDASLYLDVPPTCLSRSPPPSAVKSDEASRKRRTPDPEACSDPSSVWEGVKLPQTESRGVSPQAGTGGCHNPWSHMCLSAQCPVPLGGSGTGPLSAQYPVPVEALQTSLTPDAMEHWQRLRRLHAVTDAGRALGSEMGEASGSPPQRW